MLSRTRVWNQVPLFGTLPGVLPPFSQSARHGGVRHVSHTLNMPSIPFFMDGRPVVKFAGVKGSGSVALLFHAASHSVAPVV